jgi:hypothetical protein
MMNMNTSIRFVTLALVLQYGSSTDIELHTVETNRASRQFLVGSPRTAGYTYLDTMKFESVSKMELG